MPGYAAKRPLAHAEEFLRTGVVLCGATASVSLSVTPGGDVGGGEEEHRQAQAALPAARYPALSRVQQANVAHDPGRIFELALDGLILALQAHHPGD